MPLEHGKSKKAFEHNIEAEMHEGKPQNQSLAIAYAMKKKAKKMAEGGMLTNDGYQSECSADCNDPSHEHLDPQANMHVSHEGDVKRPNGMAMEQDDKMLNQHGEDEIGPEGRHMAHGGQMEPMHGEQGPEHDMDMVDHIMKKRQMMYSEGGKVANDTHEFEADFEDPNKFDVLPMEDDLESSYTGKNSGDELGNEWDANHHDMVDEIMLKRRKQHNPNPA